MDVETELRVAARALARHGLVHAYGHVSVRLDPNRFLVCAARPMALIRAGETGTIVAVTGPLPEGVLGEVRVHQQIYARRPDVRAVARIMPPAVMALSTAHRTPRPRHGFGSYFRRGAALWDDPQLLRDDVAAKSLAQTLGDETAVVMRGNGAVIAADSLMRAVVLCWYLEDAARVELAILGAGLEQASAVLGEAECGRRATASGQIFERMWDYLTACDPEL
ncbi:class II aldolase/adducin family protein [Trinickia symbiotica]|nr:class II aldolase/adducin family protein [Trinickia symbiotica]